MNPLNHQFIHELSSTQFCFYKMKFLLLLLFPVFTAMQPQDNTHRKLLLVAENAANSSLQQQLAIASTDSAGFAERDLVIELVTANNNAALYQKITAGKKGFTVILIGKDGGEKFRDHQPISAEHLFGLISAMPIRMAEIKKKG